MLNDDEIRWRQIFENYEKAFLALQRHKDESFYKQIEKAGDIHYFEIVLDLASRVMFAYLNAKGKSTDNFRHAVKELNIEGVVQNQNTWFKAYNRRKLPLFLHKNEKLFDELVLDINETYFIELEYFYQKLMERK